MKSTAQSIVFLLLLSKVQCQQNLKKTFTTSVEEKQEQDHVDQSHHRNLNGWLSDFRECMNPTEPIPKTPTPPSPSPPAPTSTSTEPSTVSADEKCISFCDQYFRVCAGFNAYFNPDSPRGDTALGRRHLIAGTETELPRLEDDDLSGAYKTCLSSCMLFPRPLDPALYNDPINFGTEDEPNIFGANLGSDTLWCRQRHLDLADSGTLFDPIFHCSHASPSGGGICRDALVDGATPFEHFRAGTSTRRHLGYCDLAADDTVAECTKASITDDLLPTVLSLLPSTVKILIMNNNRDITTIPSGIFNNLQAPGNIKALIMEDCNITSIDADGLDPLVNLEVFNINMHLLTSLPSALFSKTTKLKQFSAFSAAGRGGGITALPEGLFANTPDLERLVAYGQSGLTAFPANIFKGLTKLEMISFVLCGFDSAGFPDGVFSDLESLLWFDFFGCKLDAVKADWFDGGWGGSILRLALDNNPINSVDAGAFDTLTNLENCYLHNTNLKTLPENLFANNANLISYTLNPL